MSQSAESNNLTLLEQNLVHLLQELDGQHSLQINSRFEVRGERSIKHERLVRPISQDIWPNIEAKNPSLKLSRVSNIANWGNLPLPMPPVPVFDFPDWLREFLEEWINRNNLYS